MDLKRTKRMMKCLLFVVLFTVSCNANGVYNGRWMSNADWLQYSIQVEISRHDKVLISYFQNQFYVYADKETGSLNIPEKKEGVFNRDQREIVFNNGESVMQIVFCNSDMMIIAFNDGTTCDFLKER